MEPSAPRWKVQSPANTFNHSRASYALRTGDAPLPPLVGGVYRASKKLVKTPRTPDHILLVFFQVLGGLAESTGFRYSFSRFFRRVLATTNLYFHWFRGRKFVFLFVSHPKSSVHWFCGRTVHSGVWNDKSSFSMCLRSKMCIFNCFAPTNLHFHGFCGRKWAFWCPQPQIFIFIDFAVGHLHCFFVSHPKILFSLILRSDCAFWCLETNLHFQCVCCRKCAFLMVSQPQIFISMDSAVGNVHFGAWNYESSFSLISRSKMCILMLATTILHFHGVCDPKCAFWCFKRRHWANMTSKRRIWVRFRRICLRRPFENQNLLLFQWFCGRMFAFLMVSEPQIFISIDFTLDNVHFGACYNKSSFSLISRSELFILVVATTNLHFLWICGRICFFIGFATTNLHFYGFCGRSVHFGAWNYDSSFYWFCVRKFAFLMVSQPQFFISMEFAVGMCILVLGKTILHFRWFCGRKCAFLRLAPPEWRNGAGGIPPLVLVSCDAMYILRWGSGTSGETVLGGYLRLVPVSCYAMYLLRPVQRQRNQLVEKRCEEDFLRLSASFLRRISAVGTETVIPSSG